MSQVKSPPSASSAGFRKGAHVVITGPPRMYKLLVDVRTRTANIARYTYTDNNRKGGSAADPHEGATGVITREGSSSNGGWFELRLDHTNELVYYRRGSIRVLGYAYDSDSDDMQLNAAVIQRHTTRQRDRERERERRRARAAADRAAKDEHSQPVLPSSASTASTELEMDDQADGTMDSTVAYSSDEFEANYYMYTTQHQKHVEHDIMELERVSVRRRRRKQTPMRSIQACGSPSLVCTLYNAVSIY